MMVLGMLQVVPQDRVKPQATRDVRSVCRARGAAAPADIKLRLQLLAARTLPPLGLMLRRVRPCLNQITSTLPIHAVHPDRATGNMRLSDDALFDFIHRRRYALAFEHHAHRVRLGDFEFAKLHRVGQNAFESISCRWVKRSAALRAVCRAQSIQGITAVETCHGIARWSFAHDLPFQKPQDITALIADEIVGGFVGPVKVEKRRPA